MITSTSGACEVAVTTSQTSITSLLTPSRWNTLGDCKFTITDKGHTEWVSCVRFSPNPQNPVIVSAGWDKYVKVSTRPSLLAPDMMYYTSICYFRASGP